MLLVTVINVTLNTANISSDNVLDKASVDTNQTNLNLLVKNIENDISSEIENEQTAILNDIKQFNELFLL
ncbi:MAG: hypothetical protein AB8B80_13780 [Marinicellaceae bacterium]